MSALPHPASARPSTVRTSAQLTLEPLPHPVYFVAKDPKWAALIADPSLAFDDAMYQMCTTGHDIWSVQLYLDLKRAGLDVHLVPRPLPGRICVIPFYNLDRQDQLHLSFVVACRYDTPSPLPCDLRTVMNPLQVRDARDQVMPHRPQPMLRARDPARGCRLEHLVFKGHSYNLAEPFRSTAFQEQLGAMGVKLVMGTENQQSAFTDWADYTQADAVIAVRNNTAYDIALKPALKLVNGWLAGVPSILGPEPAYQDLRRSPLDYFEVRTPEQALAAVRQLKESPALFEAMVANGFERAEPYTAERVIRLWREYLAGPVAEGYQQWNESSPLERRLLRPLRYALRGLQQRKARQYYQHHIHHGPRILEQVVVHGRPGNAPASTRTPLTTAR